MRDPREFSFLRSRVTWFGIAGLAFLLWAWVDSMGHSSVVTRGHWLFGHEAGHVSVSKGYHPTPAWVWFRARLDHDEAFPGFLVDAGSDGLNRLLIPHWMMVAVYLLLWSAALFYRWRIHRRAMRLPYEAEAP